MRGPVGLVIGLVIGAGGMYLVLRPPWAGGSTSVVADAGVVAAAPGDAGKPSKKKPGKRRVQRPTGDPANPMMTIDEALGPEDGETIEEGPNVVQVSAAEMRMETRGRAVASPTKIDMGGGNAARALDQGEIQSTIGGQAGGVRDCVVKGATGTSMHNVTVNLSLAVDGSGKVTSHAVTAPSYMLSHGLYDCTTRAVARMKFPAVGGSTVVDFPVTVN